MLPDGSDLVAEEMNKWMDLNGMEFYIHYTLEPKAYVKEDHYTPFHILCFQIQVILKPVKNNNLAQSLKPVSLV